MRKSLFFMFYVFCFYLPGCAFEQSYNIPYSVEPDETYSWPDLDPPIDKAIRNLLGRGGSVRIAVVGRVTSSISREMWRKGGADFDQWKELTFHSATAHIEEELTKSHYLYGNFTIVDRATLGKVLEEQALHLSGAIAEHTAVKVGRLVGASHIVLWHYSRTLERAPRGEILIDGLRFNARDVLTTRLIDVETGIVLASQWMTRRVR